MDILFTLKPWLPSHAYFDINCSRMAAA